MERQTEQQVPGAGAAGLAEKKVIIGLRGDVITIKQWRVPVRKELDQVSWIATNCKARVIFDYEMGSPFARDTFDLPEARPQLSGPVRPDVIGPKLFSYTVYVTLKDGTEIGLDPEVEVDGGGKYEPPVQG